MMKKIIIYLSLIITAGMFALSCNLNTLPKFDDKDAFVAFEKTTMSFKETSGIVEIPVTLASVKGVSSQVSYEAIDGDDPVKGAKVNVDYKLVDANPVLNFDAENRTCTIKVEIIPHKGTFTGDKSFKLHITDSGKVNAGEENVCTINILDIDHPLSSILATYEISAVSYFDGAVAWDLTFLKDPDDVSVVWVESIVPELAGKAGFYGVAEVDEQGTVLTVKLPLGQVNTEVKVNTPDGKLYLFGCTADGDIMEEGYMVIEFSNGGNNLLFGTDCGPIAGEITEDGKISAFNVIFPGGTGVKK